MIRAQKLLTDCLATAMSKIKIIHFLPYTSLTTQVTTFGGKYENTGLAESLQEALKLANLASSSSIAKHL